MKTDKNISQYIALLLRHKPEKGNIKIDEFGYTEVESLIKAVGISRQKLDEIVENDTKGRYSYDETKTKIRANHGHSIPYVHVDYKKFVPNGKLYHGSAKKYEDSILKSGLLAQNRNFVHISKDLNMAIDVGMRHAKTKENLIVFEIDAQKMVDDGIELFESEDGVVLAKSVPLKYLNKMNL